MPESHLDQNAAASDRLRALVAVLGAADLGRSLGGGWTVAVALAHLAFWDGRQHAALEHFAATGEQLGEESDDAVNVGLGPLLPTVDRASAGRLAIEAAAAVDAAVARLDDAQAQVLAAGPNAYLMLRHYHRDEHIDQIEAALGG